MATFTITVSTMARRAIYTGGNQGTVYEVDATITYTPAVSLQATITALDATVTYNLLQGTVSALDATVSYELLQGQITALDAEVTYGVLQGQITALDATVTYDLLQALISALDANILYGEITPSILPTTGPLVINAPTLPNVSASLVPAVITGVTAGSIGVITVVSLPSAVVGLARFAVGDVYWRVWCVPSFMRPQNPERDVNIPFTVWMAYPYDNTLTSIGGTGQTGLTLDLSAPRDFFSCEELVVNLQIGTSAPVTISALYLFNFTTGQGVFLFETTLLDWLWAVPEEPVVERWEWLSDIMRAWDSTEQRISIRKQPRRTLEFRFIIEDDAARAQELHRWYHSLSATVIVPYYQYATKITVASAITDTKIFFDPDQTDMRDGEHVVIYRAATETSYLLKLDTVEADGATLDSPLTTVIEIGDYVAPAFACRLEDKTGPHMTTVSGEMVVKSFVMEPRISFTRPGSSAIIATFDSLAVLERRPASPVDDIVDANVTVIDNESGVPEMKSSWLHAMISGRRSFEVAHRIPQDAFDSLDYWRDFFDATVGPRISFLFPTWRRDLVLANTPIPGSYQLVIEGTTYTSQYFPYDTFKRMQFEATDGTVIWRKVSAAEEHPDNTTLITLTEALPNEPRWGVDFTISYLNRVRLATDEVLLTHYSTRTTLEIAVTTVDQ